MGHYAVIREAGSAWCDGKGIAGQPGLNDHAAYMDALATEGFVLVAGPLAGTEAGRLRALLVVSAGSEADIHDRLGDDPWASSGRHMTVSVEPWNVFVGADRLLAHTTAHA